MRQLLQNVTFITKRVGTSYINLGKCFKVFLTVVSRKRNFRKKYAFLAVIASSCKRKLAQVCNLAVIDLSLCLVCCLLHILRFSLKNT